MVVSLIVQNCLAQTVRPQVTLDIDVDLALLGAAIALNVGRLPPGVVPCIVSIASGWGTVSVTRTRLPFYIWDTRRQALRLTSLMGSSYTP